LPPGASRFAQVAQLIDQSKISIGSAAAIFDKLAEGDAEPQALATQLGLAQVSDTGAIDTVIASVIEQNPKAVQDFKAGKQAAMNSLFGQVMKQAKGFNPRVVRELLQKRLSE